MRRLRPGKGLMKKTVAVEHARSLYDHFALLGLIERMNENLLRDRTAVPRPERTTECLYMAIKQKAVS